MFYNKKQTSIKQQPLWSKMFLILTLLFSIKNYSQEQHEKLFQETEELLLKGNVESIKLTFYEMAIEGNKVVRVESPFMPSFTFSYDKNKMELSEYNTEEESNHIPIEHSNRISTYDKNKKLVKDVFYSQGKAKYVTRYIYKDGLISEKVHFYLNENKEEIYHTKSLYHYNSDKKLIEKIIYDDRDLKKIDTKYSYVYKDNNLSELKKYNSDNEVVLTKKYQYTEQNRIETVLYHSRDEIYIYNSKNELLGYKFLNSEEEPEKYICKYEYDSFGNWIRLTEFSLEKRPKWDDVNDTIKEVEVKKEKRSIERKIKYHQ